MGSRDIVEQYVERWEKLYQEHRVLERAEGFGAALLHHLKFQPDDNKDLPKIFTKLDNLDKERVKYMVVYENYVRRTLPNGIYEWSILLKTTGRTIAY